MIPTQEQINEARLTAGGFLASMAAITSLSDDGLALAVIYMERNLEQPLALKLTPNQVMVARQYAGLLRGELHGRQYAVAERRGA